MEPGSSGSRDDTDGLTALLAAVLKQNEELLAQIKVLLARIAALEARGGQPPKTPDNSSLPPSRGQKANVEPPRTKTSRKGRAGVARALCENPDATRDIYANRCACGTALSAADHVLAHACGHIDLPPIRPITTRINLHKATCPCCKTRVNSAMYRPIERVQTPMICASVVLHVAVVVPLPQRARSTVRT